MDCQWFYSVDVCGCHCWSLPHIVLLLLLLQVDFDFTVPRFAYTPLFANFIPKPWAPSSPRSCSCCSCNQIRRQHHLGLATSLPIVTKHFRVKDSVLSHCQHDSRGLSLLLRGATLNNTASNLNVSPAQHPSSFKLQAPSCSPDF